MSVNQKQQLQNAIIEHTNLIYGVNNSISVSIRKCYETAKDIWYLIGINQNLQIALFGTSWESKSSVKQSIQRVNEGKVRAL